MTMSEMSEMTPTTAEVSAAEMDGIVSAAGVLSGVRFKGLGWYELPDRVILVTDVSGPPVGPLQQILARLQAATGSRPERMLVHSWTRDPRPTMERLLSGPDLTPVPIPDGLQEVWPRIQEEAESVRAWAQAEMARKAPPDMAVPSVPPIGPLPTVLRRGNVGGEGETRVIQVGLYKVYLTLAERAQSVLDRIARGELQGIGSERVFVLNGIGVAVRLSPAED